MRSYVLSATALAMLSACATAIPPASGPIPDYVSEINKVYEETEAAKYYYNMHHSEAEKLCSKGFFGHPRKSHNEDDIARWYGQKVDQGTARWVALKNEWDLISDKVVILPLPGGGFETRYKAEVQANAEATAEATAESIAEATVDPATTTLTATSPVYVTAQPTETRTANVLTQAPATGYAVATPRTRSRKASASSMRVVPFYSAASSSAVPFYTSPSSGFQTSTVKETAQSVGTTTTEKATLTATPNTTVTVTQHHDIVTAGQ